MFMWVGHVVGRSWTEDDGGRQECEETGTQSPGGEGAAKFVIATPNLGGWQALKIDQPVQCRACAEVSRTVDSRLDSSIVG